MSVPQSLLPEDYNIVKNTGVLGLLLHKEYDQNMYTYMYLLFLLFVFSPYAVTLDNHEKHLTVFPSL